MAYEQKDNSGSLFKNDQKKSSTHPDYKGSAKVDGQEYWLSAWIKQTKKGQTYMSLSFTEKSSDGNVKKAVSQQGAAESLNDSIPF